MTRLEKAKELRDYLATNLEDVILDMPEVFIGVTSNKQNQSLVYVVIEYEEKRLYLQVWKRQNIIMDVYNQAHKRMIRKIIRDKKTALVSCIYWLGRQTLDDKGNL